MSGTRTLFAVAALALGLALPGLAAAQANSGGRGIVNGHANQAAAGGRTAAEWRTPEDGQVAEEQRAMTNNPTLVSRVQQTLNALGYSAQPLTGTWNNDTALAMQYFQAAHGLPPIGQLNQASLEALGLAPSRADTANAGPGEGTRNETGSLSAIGPNGAAGGGRAGR
jgi:putative peptidoglycan binding protein